MAFTDKFSKEDYYLSDEGFIIFTEIYHLKRGYCCQSGCKHCPWEYGKKIKKNNNNNDNI
jgi:Family of unknown function (DUF5522)